MPDHHRTGVLIMPSPFSSQRFDVSRARGFSLVELMVAMAIGLVLLSVVGAIFLSSKSTFVASESRGRVNEASRLVNDVIGSMARQAGYVDVAITKSNFQAIIFEDLTQPRYKPDTGIVALFACANGRVDFSTIPWGCTANPVVAGQLPSDSIVFSYQSQPADPTVEGSGLKAFAGGIGGDCNGNNPMPSVAIASTAMPTNSPIAVNEFYVGRGIVTTQNGQSVNIPELYCRGNGEPLVPQPIAQGVEQLRAFFHVSTGLGFLKTMRRLSIAGVGADWGKVEAIDVCAVMLSPGKPGNAGGKLAGLTYDQYRDCDGTIQTSADGRMRKATWYSFNLRNRTTTRSAVF